MATRTAYSVKKFKLSETQQSELNFLCNWSYVLCDFFDEHKILNSKTMREGIEKGKTMGYLSGAKDAYRTINSIANELPQTKLTELNRRLREKFGKDLFDADKKLVQKAKKIAERGKIRNEEEYRLLRSYLDSIEGIAEHEEEYNRLYDIYFTFESQF